MNRRKVTIRGCLLGLALVAGIAYVAHHVDAQQAGPGVMAPAAPRLGAPTAPARMSKQDVLDAARGEFGSGLAGHPITMQYGSFTDSHLQVRGASGMQSSGTHNVWMVTITGVDMIRPCDVKDSQLQSHPVCPPDAQTMVMYIDDASGKLVEAMAY